MSENGLIEIRDEHGWPLARHKITLPGSSMVQVLCPVDLPIDATRWVGFFRKRRVLDPELVGATRRHVFRLMVEVKAEKVS